MHDQAVDSSVGRWFTAIPLDYREGDSFWTRDAGLLCQGLRAIGSDARMVCLGDAGYESTHPLILAPERDLHSDEWWRQWGLDGVLIISWALRRFEPIVSAIRRAGIRLCIKMDTDGILTPHVWLRRYFQIRIAALRDSGRQFAWLQALARTAYSYVFSTRQNASVVRHLEFADMLTIESPLALQRYARGLRKVGGASLIEKLRLLPHPVGEQFCWSGERKERLIVTVGRWNAHIKGAPLLIKVLENVLAEFPNWKAKIIGPGEVELHALLSACDSRTRSKVTVTGEMPSPEVAETLRASQVAISTSYSESFGIALAESLACGASIVGCAEIASFNWFASGNSGTLAAARNQGLFEDALRAEIAAWECGQRDAGRISSLWGPQLRTSGVAFRLLQLAGSLPGRKDSRQGA